MQGHRGLGGLSPLRLCERSGLGCQFILRLKHQATKNPSHLWVTKCLSEVLKKRHIDCAKHHPHCECMKKNVAVNWDHYFHPLESVSYISNSHHSDTKIETLTKWLQHDGILGVSFQSVLTKCPMVWVLLMVTMLLTWGSQVAYDTSCCSSKHCATSLQHARANSIHCKIGSW